MDWSFKERLVKYMWILQNGNRNQQVHDRHDSGLTFTITQLRPLSKQPNDCC